MPRRWVALGATITALGLLVAGGAYALRSDVFTVQRVEVRGTSLVVPADVAERVGLAGESLITADLSVAEKKVAALPLVRSATVQRVWPNTLRITVEERQPWGIWEQSGVQYTIDRDGVVLGLFQAPDGAPVIKSAEQGSRHQGDRVDHQAVEAALQIYGELPGALGVGVAEVAFLAGKGVQVTTSNGRTALFGDSSSISYKLAVWGATQKQAHAQGIEYTTIDLRFGNRPVLQ